MANWSGVGAEKSFPPKELRKPTMMPKGVKREKAGIPDDPSDRRRRGVTRTTRRRTTRFRR